MNNRKPVHATAAMILLSVFALPSLALAQSFIGQWTGTAVTPGGEFSETLDVSKISTGYAITAKLIGAAESMPSAGPGTDIVLSGDTFSYKRSIPGVLVVTYTGTVSGDTFIGTVDMAGTKMPYKGVRIKKGK